MATAVFGMWTALRFGGPRLTLVVDDIGEILPAWLAAGLCATRWRRGATSYRRFWAYMGASAFAWGAGEVVWCWYEVGLGRQVPFPSLADLGFLASIPLVAMALLQFPVPALGPKLRLRAVLDGALVASALLFVSWATVLGPMFNAHQGSLFEQVLSLAYPIGDVVVATVVLCVAARSPRSGRVVLARVGMGVVAMALADSSFTYLTQVNNYGIGNVVDTGWFAGYLLVALAALWPEASGKPATSREADGTSRLGAFIPYGPALAALVTVIVFRASGRRLGTLLIWDEFVLALLVGGRQLMTVLDNIALSQRLAAKAEHQHARFAALVRRSSDLTTIVSAEAVIEYESPAVQSMLRHSASQLVGTSLLELVHPDDRGRWLGTLAHVIGEPGSDATVEMRLRAGDGTFVPVDTRVTNLLEDPNVAGIVLNSRDVSERKRLEEELRHQAFHDPLTGLANRALFTDRLTHALDRQERTDRVLGVLFVDLDNFKAVNDGWGHTAGDELLRAVGQRVRDTVRVGDTVARLGGDEFAILVDGLASEADPVVTADRILDALKLPFTRDGSEILVHASIGIATSLTGQETAGELVRNADVAMYAAKGRGKGRREEFRPGLDDQLIDRLQLEAQLHLAINRHEFVVHYQPIVNTATGAVVGLEALMRWEHPERGLVPPSEFIPAAESSGFIVPMGAWLLARACHDAKAFQEEAEMSGLGISVNLSARQLDDPGLLPLVASSLSNSGLDPDSLTLEITESVLMSDPEGALRVLQDLRAMGVRLAIDDFGTGYSSLGYLQRLPVNGLKIDRCFVEGLRGGLGEAQALVRTIVQLAQDFDLLIVGEGVETEDERQALDALGCRLAQGYLFGRPMDAAHIRRTLARAAREPAHSIPPRGPLRADVV